MVHGWNALLEYLSEHVLTCLIPAFFIAGAIAVFVSKDAIMKYFGPEANRLLSYGVASVSGTLLAVCSCTVLPLFTGIYKRGAGLGPAIAFLFSGPAINLLAIVYSARLLGLDIGIARAVGAVSFSLVVGLLMALIFRREEQARQVQAPALTLNHENEKKPPVLLAYFAALVGILVFGAAARWWETGAFAAGLVLVVGRWFSWAEVKEWLVATWDFVKQITPWLLGGVFAAGMISAYMPQSWIASTVGDNSLWSNLLASVVGAFFYFATLTEVPIVKSFMELGMDKGPVLALLLAGPALSLPNMLVIRSVLGTRKTLVYVLLVIVLATAAGMLFGAL